MATFPSIRVARELDLLYRSTLSDIDKSHIIDIIFESDPDNPALYIESKKISEKKQYIIDLLDPYSKLDSNTIDKTFSIWSRRSCITPPINKHGNIYVDTHILADILNYFLSESRPKKSQSQVCIDIILSWQKNAGSQTIYVSPLSLLEIHNKKIIEDIDSPLITSKLAELYRNGAEWLIIDTLDMVNNQILMRIYEKFTSRGFDLRGGNLELIDILILTGAIKNELYFLTVDKPLKTLCSRIGSTFDKFIYK